jgi:hypothetical protein
MSNQPVFTCFICGNELIEKNADCICTYCGKLEQGEWICPQGHYICEECRLSPVDLIINNVCLKSTAHNAWDIATLIMQHPVVPHHGAVHHLITAPAILTALVNSGQIDFKKERIPEVLKRTVDIPYGVCGSRGDCGACIGAGAAASIILKATFKSNRERSLVLKTTANALLRVAELSGPRCCKQSVYATLESCSHFFKEELKLDLPLGDKTCIFSRKITECKGKDCPYYNE